MRLAQNMAGLVLVLGLANACGSNPVPTPQPSPAPPISLPPVVQPQEKRLIPAGFGTLKQDEFTVALRSGALLIKVTPLAESVTRTAAPDTYTRLHALLENRKPEAQRVAGPTTNVELFLVTLFSYEPDVTYQPENLQITHQGRPYRPIAIMPITSGWGKQQLQQQQNQSAVYAFATTIDYEQPLTVRYGLEQSDDWTRIISRIQV
jgi:hypothetical protein